MFLDWEEVKAVTVALLIVLAIYTPIGFVLAALAASVVS